MDLIKIGKYIAEKKKSSWTDAEAIGRKTEYE